MIKKTAFLFLLVFATMACKNQAKESKSASSAELTQAVEVTELLASISDNTDKEVIVVGTVNHVCSHSGRRAFLVDSTGENSIRIEAAGEIESFGKELVGSELKVKCIIKENKLTKEDIDQMEVTVLENHPEDAEAEGENCSAEMQNVKSMREWMKENSKDYFATYYAEGISYEVVE